MVEVPLPTYDPDWQSRWAAAHAVLIARQSSGVWFQGTITREEREQHSIELGALNAAYRAQFRTVEAYRDHFMALEMRMSRGHNVPQPHFREGASLEEVDALLCRFREDVRTAEHLRFRPISADPPGLVPFTALQRPDSQRSVEDFMLSVPRSYRAIECRLAMEATAHDLHVCIISVPDGGSVTNNIEALATAIYRERFASGRIFDRMRTVMRINRAGLYRPRSVMFYEYWPWTLAAQTGLREELSIVRMVWDPSQGFVAPKSEHVPSVPPYLSALVDSPPRAFQGSVPRLLGKVAVLSAS